MTELQERVLSYVREFQRTKGVPPSTRDVARWLDRSQPTALGHLRALARKGLLEKMADGRWGFGGSESQTQLFSAPVYGSIPAGLPAMREQEAEERIPINPAVFGIRNPREHDFWLLRVTGDSMVGADILEGDLVALVRREPRSGEIIAALIDENETTLKRFVRKGRKVFLRAANARYDDLEPKQLEPQGVVVGLVRRTIP